MPSVVQVSSPGGGVEVQSGQLSEDALASYLVKK